MAAKIYFFGCIRGAGHYMYKSGENNNAVDYDFLDKNPWGNSIDGSLCLWYTRKQGIASLHHKDGWTALSFWDNSVDGRPGSNGNFLAEGTFNFGGMIALAKEKFPNVMSRFNFEITSGEGE